MNKKKKVAPKAAHPIDWEINDFYDDKEQGREFSFRDHTGADGGTSRRGKFLFHVTTPTDTWVTFIEILPGSHKGGIRSIHPERITKWWRQTHIQPSPKQKRKL